MNVEYWCFNCHQCVEKDEIFSSQRHENFLYERLATVNSTRALSREQSICICQDCVFYRIQVCSCCNKGAPLCMYTLEEWFTTNALNRQCLDCTALKETLHISFSLPYRMPTSQFVQQCLECSKFKYICSFIIPQHYHEEECCHRAIRDGNELLTGFSKDICIECKLFHDIRDYKILLKEKYNFRISLEPTVGHSISNVSKQTVEFIDTYASIVKGDKIKLNHEISAWSQLASHSQQSNGPVFVISTLKDVISDPIITTMKRCLKSLEEKARLELKLSGMSTEIWQGVLQQKMKSTTHAFSLQGTQTTDFSAAEMRWAYIAVYSPVHASIVYDTMATFGCSLFQSLIPTMNNNESFEVCCFGAGPGSEVVGIHHFLPKKTIYHLFDNCILWKHNAKDLLEEGLQLSFTFSEFDVTKRMDVSVKKKIKKAKLFTFIRFLSAVQNLSEAVNSLRTIIDIAPDGSSFLFIDNSLMSIKNFVESLIFKNRDYEETKNCKENKKYAMYTSYAEYRFEIEEILAKQPAMRNFISLVDEWLERPPLSDVRVYIFIVLKKCDKK